MSLTFDTFYFLTLPENIEYQINLLLLAGTQQPNTVQSLMCLSHILATLGSIKKIASRLATLVQSLRCPLNKPNSTFSFVITKEQIIYLGC